MLNTPNIRFKGFIDDWEQRKLGDVATLTSSKRVHASDYVDNGIPFFRGSEISKLGGNTKLEDVLYISEQLYEQLKRNYGVPKENDILITAVGTLGNTFVIKGNTPFYFKDGNLIWLKDIQINSDYLGVYIGDGIGKQRVLNSAAGSNQKALTMVKLNEVVIDCPSEAEQKVISSFFSNLDNLITLHQRKCNETKKLKKYMLQKMFPKKGEKNPEIRFEGFTDDWEQRKLSDFGKATGGTSIESEFSDNGRYKVISIGSYSEDSVYRDQGIRAIDSDKTRNRILNKGDLTMILNDKTASGNIIGRALLIEESDVYVYNQRTERIEIDHDNYDSLFVYEMLNAPAIREKIIKQSQGNTQIYVNWSIISSTEYIVPRIEEQRKIGEYLNNLDNLITLHQRKCDELKEIKKYMLQNMFPKKGD